MNIAAWWKLPVIYVIENNKYAMGTSLERASAGTELYRRGQACGIPGVQVDGMDVVAIQAAGEKAVAHSRAGKGPYILEMLTYRYRGHSMSDPAKYRTRDEVEKVRNESDPIQMVRARIVNTGIASEDHVKGIEKAIRQRVTEAAECASEGPEPDPAELWTDVYL